MKYGFLDTYNLVTGAVVAALSAVFGVYWYLFSGYLVLNVIDWGTGWYRSARRHEESSKAGLRGICKKTGYWVIILVAFMTPDLLIKLARDTMGKDLSFMTALGWITLAMLIVNEIRSILENLVECGYEVPVVLIKSLAVTDKMLRAHADSTIPEEEQKK